MNSKLFYNINSLNDIQTLGTTSRSVNGMSMTKTIKKYISLLSIVQSQSTYTPATRNQATGFSSKSHHQAYYIVFCHRPDDGSLKLKPVA
jgi:hypothetical protein